MTEKEFIELHKSAFQELIKLLDITEPKCKYCGIQVRKNNFGLIAKDIISCKNIICLSQAVGEFEQPEKAVEKEVKTK